MMMISRSVEAARVTVGSRPGLDRALSWSASSVGSRCASARTEHWVFGLIPGTDRSWSGRMSPRTLQGTNRPSRHLAAANLVADGPLGRKKQEASPPLRPPLSGEGPERKGNCYEWMEPEERPRFHLTPRNT